MGFFIFGLIAAAAGLIICRFHKESVNSTESFSGVVTGISEKILPQGHLLVKKYRPVVKFTMNGRTYTADHHKYSQIILHNVGETVIICVNPQMPKYFCYAEEEQPNSLIGIILISCGIFVCILSLVFLVIH